ncbi:MAG: hypothetical protein LBN40_06415 [Oscillospiraceae bacterium]|jgi:hypothetical protein|nr:hypothetical protein [Oscillospiraceae bacterium]
MRYYFRRGCRRRRTPIGIGYVVLGVILVALLLLSLLSVRFVLCAAAFVLIAIGVFLIKTA